MDTNSHLKMNIGRAFTPPDNSAIVPDIYNKLDAILIERTRVANTILDLKLNVEQRLIAKYRRESERLMKAQKSQVLADLTRISNTLPGQLPYVSQSKNRVQKGYMTGRRDELICHRCYIHHLPTKKRFYSFNSPFAPSPAEEHGAEGEAGGNGDNLTSPRDEFADANERTSASINLPTLRVIAPVEKYRFLDRDGLGRERDLNDSITPRLMPYEDWKTVVKNVCNQCKRKVEVVSRGSLSRRSSRISRERTRFGSRADIHERPRASRSEPRVRSRVSAVASDPPSALGSCRSDRSSRRPLRQLQGSNTERQVSFSREVNTKEANTPLPPIRL